MTALAQLLQGLGAKVSGSDTAEEFFTVDILKNLQIPVKRRFAAENIGDAEIIVSSVAYLLPDSDNPEILKAKETGLPLLSYPEVLAMFFKESFGVAVAGSHGKSTTSAMLAVALEKAGLDPTAVVGTKVLNWGTNARIKSQSGDFIRRDIFVAEADEYKSAFLRYPARAAVITNIDWDHPDHFPTALDYKNAFGEFVKKLPPDGFLAINGDDDSAREIARLSKARVIFYGEGKNNDFTLKNFGYKNSGVVFEAVGRGENLGEFKTSLIGRHNALNALAVVAAGLELGADLEKMREGLAVFLGTARRFEKMGERDGILIYDDYAHHPSEIRSTLTAVREAFGKGKIWAVFQPHTYSRTAALLNDFVDSFGTADNVVILDIYSSARENKGNINSAVLAKMVKKTGREVFYKGSTERAADFLKQEAGPGDIIITMGAGDVWKTGRDFIHKE